MMMIEYQRLAEAIFYLGAAVIAYVYAIYPMAIWTCSRLWGRQATADPIDDAKLPTMTLLIAAHNEEAVIGDRLENALSLDYPREKFQVVVASDGSTDNTAPIVRQYADQGVILFDVQPNRGKAATLNAAWSRLNSEIVLLSDANTSIDSQAPRRLARWFCSPEVGAVCGRLVLRDPNTGCNVDSIYWRYETFLKKCESRLGALLGANGAIYAVRRTMHCRIPTETIVDDLVIPLLIALRARGRLLYDEQAVAHEETPPEIRDEFRRRVRIGAGGFQSIRLLWPLLNPRYGWLALSFFSHKLLRWLGPFFLLAEFAANAFLIRQPIYFATLVAQLSFLLLAVLGAKCPGQGYAAKAVRLPAMFVAMNLALLLGFYRWLSHSQSGVWIPTSRLASNSALRLTGRGSVVQAGNQSD